jgi:hypothetical protein
MSKNRTITVISICLLVIIIGLYLIIKITSGKKTPAIKAVPLDASFIVESRDLLNLTLNLAEENPMWNEIMNTPILSEFSSRVRFIDSIINENSGIKSYMDANPITVSAHLKGKDKIEYLFLVNIPKKSLVTDFTEQLSRTLKNKAKIVERNYNDEQIFEVVFPARKDVRNFAYAFSKGLFLLSHSTILLQESIRQLSTETSLISTQAFQKLSSTAGKNADANIYISYKNLARILMKYLNQPSKEIAFDMENFGTWSEADLNVKSNSVQLNGFTFTNPNHNNYLNIFLNQAPSKITIEKMIPAKTSCFIAFGIDDLDKFKTDYKRYLELSGTINQYNHHLNKIKELFDFDFEELYYSILSNEFAIVFTDVRSKEIENNCFAVFKTKDKKESEDKLNGMLNKYCEKNKVDITTLIFQYSINDENYLIFRNPIANVTQKLFGGVFSKNSPVFYTMIDDYLVFGNSVNGLKAYINDVVLQNTLIKTNHYKSFSNLLSTNSNIYFYAQIPKSQVLYSTLLTTDYQKLLENNMHSVRKFEALGVQFISGKELIYNNITLAFNTKEKSVPGTKWEVPLEANLSFKPQIMINHANNDKEIFIQDLTNRIYLINQNGKVLWSRMMDEPIISQISQIDYFDNDKLQYLYNTKEKIYLIDRLGRDVENYPVKLKALAANGLSVFDYDNKKDYRIFIAGQDHKIYLYTKDGEVVKDWEFDETSSDVYSEIQYFSIDNKDYIIFSDEKKTYIVNRRGKIRLKLKGNFGKSKNNTFIFEGKTSKTKPRLVTTDPSGTVFFIYLDGVVKKVKIKEYSEEHYFNYQDFDNDGTPDFFFADDEKIEVYNWNKKLIFTYKMSNTVTQKPIICSFSGNKKKIGLVNEGEGEIYLVNTNGTMSTGFPLKGLSTFTITQFSNQSTSYSLLVGNNKILCNYEIH